MDVHTRQGKFALNILLKKTTSSISRDVIRESLFYLEGLVHNRRKVREFNLRQSLYRVAATTPKLTFLPELFSPQAVEFWEQNSSEINSLRAWVLDNHFADDLRLLQSEYEKDFIHAEEAEEVEA